MNKIYEGKSKDIYLTQNPDELTCYFKDTISAGNGTKKGEIANRGILNNKITEIIFKYLENNNIKTHFIKRISDREQLIKRVTVIPLEVIIRNIASGSFSKRYDVKEGTKLDFPIFELSYKNDELGDPLMNKNHSIALRIINESEYKYIKHQALLINKLLLKLFLKANITLVDFKLEFGRLFNDKIILVDEFSPDNSRLWDITTNNKLDKDIYRDNLGDLMPSYNEVYNRIKNEKS